MIKLLLERYVCKKIEEWFGLPNGGVAFSNRVLKLQNLSLSSAVLGKMENDFNIEYSLIETLNIEIPPHSEALMRIRVKGVYIFALTQKKYSGDLLKTRISLIKSLVDYFKDKLAQETRSQAQASAFSAIFDKIIKGLELEVETVHMRIESYQNNAISAFLTRLSITTLGGSVQLENPQAIRYNKRLFLLDFALYSHSVQFESYQDLSNTDKLQRMKDYSAKVSYANISGLLLKSAAGCVILPLSFDFELKKTCLLVEGQTSYVYNINAKEFSDLSLQLSHTFIKQIENMLQVISQNTVGVYRFLQKPENTDKHNIIEDIHEFQDLFAGIYSKYLAAKDSEFFTVEKLELCLEPDVSAKFFKFLEKLSREELLEVVKAAVLTNFEEEKNPSVPAFLLRMVTNNTEEQELIKGTTDGPIVNQGLQEESKQSQEINPRHELAIRVKNQSIELKYYQDHERPKTLISRIIFHSNEFTLAGESSDYKISFNSGCIIISNHGNEIRGSTLTVSNVFQNNSSDDDANPGNLDFSLRPVETSCQVSGEYCDISLKATDIGLDHGLKEVNTMLISSKKPIDNEIDLQKSKPNAIELSIQADFSSENLLVPKTVSGTIGHFCIEDMQRLMAISQTKSEGTGAFIQKIKENLIKFSHLQSALFIVDLDCVLKTAEMGLKFNLDHAEVVTQNGNFLLKSLTSRFLANNAGDMYHEISTKFQFYLFIADNNEGGFKEYDLKISPIKIATDQKEAALILWSIREALTATNIKAAQPKKIKGKMRAAIDSIEIITFDERKYPIVKYVSEDTFVGLTHMEDSSLRILSKTATFFVNYFNKQSPTLILEYRVLGEMKHPVNYFIGNQDTTLKNVTDVSFEMGFSEDTGLDFEKYDNMLVKFSVDCELSYRDVQIKMKSWNLDSLLVVSMIQRLLYLKNGLHGPKERDRKSSQLTLSLEISDCNVFILSSEESGNQYNMICFRGEISFLLHLGRPKEKKVVSFPQKTMKYKEMATKILLDMRRFEVYIADIYQVYSKQGAISQRHKRHLIFPTEMMFSVGNSYQIYPQNERASQLEIRIKLTITKLKLQLSNDDLLIISETIRKDWLPALENLGALVEPQDLEANIKLSPLVRNVFLESMTEEIKIVLLKFANKDYAPLLQFSYHGDVCKFEYKDEELTANYGFFLACNYFNSQTGRWEPFLEKSSITCNYQGYLYTHGGPFQVSIGSQFKEGAGKPGDIQTLIELVITDELIGLVVENKEYFENLIKMLVSGAPAKKLNNFEDKGVLNQYGYQLRIDNFSGYEVEIDFKGGMISEEEKFLLANDPDSISGIVQNCKLQNQNKAIVSEIPYMLAYCLEERTNSSQSEDSLLMSLKVTDPPNNSFVAKEIEIEEHAVKRCILRNESKKKAPKEIYVSISYQDHCKMVVLHSRIMVKNQIDRSIWINIAHEDTNYTYEIEAGECMGIPEELLNGNLGVKFNFLSKKWSFNSNLKQLLENQPGVVGYIQNSKKQEFFLLRLIPDKRINSKMTLQIDHQLNITNCLPVPLKLAFRTSSSELEGERVLSPKETFLLDKFNPKNDLFITFMLRGFAWTDLMSLKSFHGVNAINNLVFKDISESQLSVNIKYESECKYPTFSVYCDSCVIDQTGFDIMLMKKEDGKENRLVSVPGYSDPFDSKLPDLKVYLLNQSMCRDLVLVKNRFTDYPTEVLPIGLVGSYKTRIDVKSVNKQKLPDLIDISLETKSLKNHHALEIYTKATFMTPSYVFVNSTKRIILLSQDSKNSDANFFQKIKPNERLGLEWTGGFQGNKKSMRISLIRPQYAENIEYSWSGELDMLNEDPIDFTLWASNPKKLYIFNLHTEKRGANTFIILQEIKSNTMIRIQNNLSDHDLIVFQAGVSGGTKFVAEKGKSTKFAWDAPNQERLEVKIELLGQEKKIYPVKDLKCDLNNLEAPQEFLVVAERKETLKMVYVVEFIDNLKVLRVYNWKNQSKEANLDLSKARVSRKKQKQFTLSLHHLGISFVSTLKNRRLELMYMTLIDTELAFEDTDDYYCGQARIKFINVDTNHNIWTIYPVLCTTANFEELKDPDRYLLNISFTMQKETKKAMKILLHPMVFKVDTDTLELVVQYFQQLEAYFYSYTGEDRLLTYRNLLLRRGNKYLLEILQKIRFENLYDWKRRSLKTTNEEKAIQFKSLEVCPAYISITFSKGPKLFSPQDTEAILSSTLNSGLDFENLILTLKGLKVIQIRDTVGKLISQVNQNYSLEVTSGFGGWLSSSVLAKSSIEYFERKSIKSLKTTEKLPEKSINGPLHELDFGRFGSTVVLRSPRTKSVVVSSATSQMINNTEVLLKAKAEESGAVDSVLKSLGLGWSAICPHLEKGVSNFSQRSHSEVPREMSNSFVKKVIKGLGSGIQDSINRGADKQVVIFFGKTLNCSRIRNPIVFYGTEKRIKDFRKIASYAVFAANQLLNEANFSELNLLEIFKLINENNKAAQDVLVVCQEWILRMDLLKYCIMWKAKCSAIMKVENQHSKILLQFSSLVNVNGESTYKASFIVRNTQLAQKIVQKIQNAMLYI